jgi:hypothetical protein
MEIPKINNGVPDPDQYWMLSMLLNLLKIEKMLEQVTKVLYR